MSVTDDLPAALYLVATPIGNLEDITLRALRVLRDCDLIACEDTRHTQKLLTHFDIHTGTVSYHEYIEAERAHEIVERIHAGQRVALVSDAGTPAVSDPGYRVVRACVEAGLTVVPVPGASAATAALIASGLPTDAYYFGGFLPARSGERRTVLERNATRMETMVFYEAPHRLLESLQDVHGIFGSRPLCVARELTKVHEELLRGSASEIFTLLEQRGTVRGEITLVIAAASQASAPIPPQPTSIAELMRARVAAGEDEKSALKAVAKALGLGRSEAYREWQRIKRTLT